MLCAALHTFCLYLFRYSESLIPLLRFVTILSASRRSRRVELRRVICDERTNELYVVAVIVMRYSIKALTKCRPATVLCFENLVCRRPVLLIVSM